MSERVRSGVDAGVVSTSQRDPIADDGYDAEVGGGVARGGCASAAVERGTEAAHRGGELPHGGIGLGGGAPLRSAQQCVVPVAASISQTGGHGRGVCSGGCRDARGGKHERDRAARRFSASGSRPSAMAARLCAARRRAWARDTAGYGPKPRSRRRPSIVTRWIQDFEPLAATFRYSVAPSPCIPGLESDFAVAAVSVPITSPQFSPRSIWELMGIERTFQARKRLYL